MYDKDTGSYIREVKYIGRKYDDEGAKQAIHRFISHDLSLEALHRRRDVRRHTLSHI